MTVAYIRNVLDERWTESINDRFVDVPTPYITTQGQDSRASLKKGDIIVVRSAGPSQVSAGALNYDAQNKDTFIQLDIRTTDKGREKVPDATRSPGATRLFGFRETRTNRDERWGGLVGEATRVLREIRRGDEENDIVDVQEVQDVSDQEDTHRYRALITVRLRRIGDKIDTSV